ncbi:MAG: hypothetical protein O7G85_06460 [Planctomycetota bacterium]|nr:hypothetical protein [Planctomycetota bacterium]
MRTLTAFKSLGLIDVKSVRRDSMLLWILVLTPGFALLFRFIIPEVAGELQARFEFDLVPFYPLIMSFLALIAAGMIGTVIGFLLLDQRDDETMTALLVTPLSLGDYLLYRLATPMVLCVVLTVFMFPLAGLTETSPLQIIATAICAAPLAPMYALFIGSFANNKVQGFALAKALGIVMVPVIISYFIDQPWQTIFGLIPHYWSLKVFWLFHDGATGSAMLHLVVGLAYQALLLLVLARHFGRIVKR